MSFERVVVFSVKENSYKIHFVSMSKTKSVNLIKKSDLNKNCTGINDS